MKFGEKLKEKRKSLKVTQAQLAADANIEISQISRIERGVLNTSIGTTYILAEALKIHVSELFIEL
ncbi:helix-turn-helix transcriptional regulator [Cryomorpha ignava]|uniref:Helix-turn-helix transcriptional regulator n=1 Tax=Cryomorpha ignava TaxID=101383 RepID=A0A7K3WT19_9FLAO|nr:helix-turn-helix transcriptional regulator [Cryomorpha ignava]